MTSTATAVRVVHPSHCPEIGPICLTREEPPQLHDQRFYLLELRATATYRVSENVAFEAQLPFKVSRTTIRFRSLDGEPYEPDYVNIHHRNETLSGLGDAWLRARVSRTFGASTHAGLWAGATLPLGRTVEDPFALGDQGLPHQHLQFGTGTVDPLLGVNGSTSLGRVQLQAHGHAQLVLTENGHRFRAGNRYAAGVSAESAAVEKLRAALAVDLLNEQPERWSGVVRQDGNVGRTDLLVGAMATYPVGRVLLRAGVKVPVYQHMIHGEHDEAGQLTYPAIVDLGLHTTLGP